MDFEQIIPFFFFITILILILPEFLRSNSKLKQFFKNLFIWCIIILSIVIVKYLILK